MWWITVGLILAGIVLMLVEMLLVPGVGIAGVFSLLSLGASCWYTFEYIGQAAGWWVTLAVLLMLVVMVVLILRNRTWKRFELKTEVNSQVNLEARKVRVGQTGLARTRLAPMGTGQFDKVTCEVKSLDNSMVSAGTSIEVVAVEDNQVIVKPINTENK